MPQCTSILDSLEWIPRSHWDFAYLVDLHYGKTLKTAAYDEYVLDEKKSNKKDDNLFEAIITLAKATNYYLQTDRKNLKAAINRFKKMVNYFAGYISLYYPIIVFDGKIYMAESSKEYGELDLTPTDHICHFFDYAAEAYDHMDFYVDVVNREAFANLLQDIVSDIESLRNALETDIDVKFRQEVEKALNWYRNKNT